MKLNLGPAVGSLPNSCRHGHVDTPLRRNVDFPQMLCMMSGHILPKVPNLTIRYGTLGKKYRVRIFLNTCKSCHTLCIRIRTCLHGQTVLNRNCSKVV